MAQNGSVGVISLDLVIKEKLTEQLDKIKAKVGIPASKVGEAVQDAVEKPMAKVGESVGKAVSKAMKEAENAADDGIEAAVQAAVARMEEQRRQLEEAVSEPPRVVEMGGWEKFDMTDIEAQVSAVADKIGQKVQETADKAKAALEGVKEDAKDVPEISVDTEKSVSKLSIVQKKWQELSHSASAVSDSLRSSLGTAFSAVRYAAEKAFSAIKKGGSKAFGFLKSAGGKTLNSLKSRFTGLGKSVSSVTGPAQKLGRTLKNTFRRVFIAAAIYGAFRALKDGIIETAKADEQFSKSLSEVKQNLAVAFAPIMQAIMPALNTMMSGLASATRQIAAFIAGLFGQTYKQAAETSKKLKGVTDTAKKAKLSLAGIDEMNILSSGDDESGSSAADAADVPEPELPDWAEKLKNSVRSGDWESVGAAFAKGINKALSSINWDKVSSTVNSGVSKLTDGINGFLDNIDWDTLGDTLAGGLNTITGAINTFYKRVRWDKLGSGIAQGLNRAIKKTNWRQLGNALGGHLQSIFTTAYNFAVNFDWSGFGEAIGTTVNGWFEAIDFGQAAKAISLGIAGVFKAAASAVESVDWGMIGDKLMEFIRNINFGAIANGFFRLFGAALGAGVKLLWTVITNVVKSIGKYFSGKIEECGGNVAAGLLSGIADGLKSIGTWIYNNIFKPFIEGFKKAFGIASPSKVMAEMGGYIIDGLFNAISSGIKRVAKICTELLNAVKGVFTGIGSWFGGIFSEAWDCVKNAFDLSNALAFFTLVWSEIKKPFNKVASFFEETFSKAWENVKKVFSKGGEVFKGITEGIYNTFKTIVDFLIDGINEVVSVPFKAINKVLGKIKDIKIVGARPFKWMPTIDVPEIPHLPALAQGGLAEAPTLAMVGDNRNAKVDPEVIAPLSKLKGMVGADPEIIELLRLIVELLRSGMNIEIINYMFKNSREFSREVIKAVAEDNARKGG